MKPATRAVVTVMLVGASSVAACTGPSAGVSSFSSGGVSTSSTTGDDDDASASSSGNSTDPIFGSQAFSFTPPPENADDHITGTHTGLTPMEGRACVVAGCHLDAKPWTVAGTVYAAVGGGAFTGQAEIGIVTPDNQGQLVFTDAQGNFWLENGTPPPQGSKVGIRVAGGKTLQMAQPLPAPPASQNCNSSDCHGSAANRIYAQ